ncbi:MULTISPECIES: histidine phosphatase family protein [unclassified Beijerinckia]|uniref:histidine phosphatase family protein n=1 Tax=unclassified Beijerinckia TaxID=2638183 RepID=UPI00089D1ADE|nr:MULTISPECIES: histidine phosphatase family protein [unclassified Beijerinckia]MDH7796522.1 broad specificity phosphatase PhoE [Beijerinckia sp. GAS462]SEC48697.1 probable phosphoglycerate mutase [Beijerinckia sp. 28-YEA-48]
MAPARLIFIRHGETDWNAEGRLQGRQDIALNARGEYQAAAAGRKLLNLLGPERVADPALPYLSSPLGRARRTMEIARTTIGLDPTAYALDDNLVELSFGVWEGKTWPQVRKAELQAAIAREADKWNTLPPEGESYAMLTERMRAWIEAHTKDCVVVSHGGVARALMVILSGLAPQRAAVTEIWQGRLLVFENERFIWI